MNRLATLTIPLAIIATIGSCGGSPSGPPIEDAAVAQVVFDQAVVSLMPFGTAQLEVALRDSRGRSLSGRSVSWRSNRPEVASVTQGGLVTAGAPGDATITATSEGVDGSVAVSVTEIPAATVSIDPDGPIALVADQSTQLTATALDGSGGSIGNAYYAWTSGNEGVAVVSEDGLVTGVSAGATQVTVASGGQSASIDVAVSEGGVVGSGPTEIVSADGTVRVMVPAGAAPPGTVITIEPGAVPPALPGTHGGTGALAYQLGPEGQTFDAPVEVTLSFGAGDLPVWVDASGLEMLRWDGSAWHTLGDVVVDEEAGTVTATTTGFSTFVLAFPLPSLSVDPSPAQVNELQRSVGLTANLISIGAILGTYEFTYAWSTPGANGTLSQTNGNQATYTATIPVIPNGVIDEVTVTAMGVSADGESMVSIASATVEIDGDLQLVVELLPFSPEIDFGDTQNFEIFTSPPLGGMIRYSWTFTENHGDFYTNDAVSVLRQGELTTLSAVAYDAKPASESTLSPPRVDQLDVTIYLMRLEGPPGMEQLVPHEVGTAQTFVRVAGHRAIGRLQTEVNGNCAEAYIYVGKIEGATSYSIHAHGYDDTGPGGFWQTELFRSWGANGGGAVIDDGDQWKYPLSGYCQVNPETRIPDLEARFAGMIVDVVIS